MKRVLLISLVLIGGLQAEEHYASRGALTEALFIIQNKHNDLFEYIMHLKKTLTHYLLLHKERDNKGHLTKETSRPDCSFEGNVLSSSIKELEELLLLLTHAINDLSKQEPLKEVFVKQQVSRAFLIKQKIDIETVMIDQMIKERREIALIKKAETTLELSLKKSSSLKKLSSPSARIQRTLRILERDIFFLKKTITRLRNASIKNRKTAEELRNALQDINKELYKNSNEKSATVFPQDCF
ncbi:hypothetical protein H0X06_01500 [Candidatus Dependentiae bacterium]|nr:hypothetical protein [Candidatus Dependentiae bacterium]